MNVLLAATTDPKSPDLLSPMLKGLFHGALAVWPIWMLIGLVGLGKLAYQLYLLRRLSKSGIAEVDQMSGQTFEVFLGTLFRRLGYGVEVTRYRGDYGADLVVTKSGQRTAVQAKRWSKRVGVKAVQEAVAAKGYYGCDVALVVANREFTQQARTLARANKVELWDRDALVGKLLEVHGESPLNATAGLPAPRELSAPEPMPIALMVDAKPDAAADEPAIVDARCVSCGVIVSMKVRDYCLARPGRFAGLVYCFNHQRKAAPTLAPLD